MAQLCASTGGQGATPPRRSVFDLSVSTRPGASEEVGRREKQKNKKQEEGPGARASNLEIHPSLPLVW